MNNERLHWRLCNLERALRRLDAALAAEVDEEKLVQTAAVKRFEFTFECCWRAPHACLASVGIHVAPQPRRVFQKSHAQDWLEDEKLWLDMLEDRKTAAHEYDEGKVSEIYPRLPAYRGAIRAVLENLRREDIYSPTLTGKTMSEMRAS